MANKGKPTKHILTYEQQVWDNYNPYYPLQEKTEEQIMTRKQEQDLKRLIKAYTFIAESAGYEISKSIAGVISKKRLNRV